MINRNHGGNIWPFLEKDHHRPIDFSANINPLGMSPKVKRVILKHQDKIPYYPDPESKYLRKALATFHNIGPDNLLIGNGSIELLHLLPKALKVRNALIVTPTFSEYEFAAKSNKAYTLFMGTKEKDDFRIDPSRIKRFIHKVDLIFLCNPNNPTGATLLRQEIIPLLKLCTRYKTTLLIDEVFIDFAQDYKNLTLLQDATQDRYILVLRSLTKFFSIAGLRLGYLIGEKKLIRKISSFQYPWNVNVLAQVVGREVINDKYYIRKTRRLISKERIYLFGNLNRIKGLKAYPPSANFIFCKLENSKIKDAGILSRRLLGKHILIRDCKNFRGLNKRFFRVAVRTRNENKKLVLSLKKILE